MTAGLVRGQIGRSIAEKTEFNNASLGGACRDLRRGGCAFIHKHTHDTVDGVEREHVRSLQEICLRATRQPRERSQSTCSSHTLHMNKQSTFVEAVSSPKHEAWRSAANLASCKSPHGGAEFWLRAMQRVLAALNSGFVLSTAASFQTLCRTALCWFYRLSCWHRCLL